MTGVATESLSEQMFVVQPEHKPESNEETYKRLHYYVAEMAVTISDYLRESLLQLRQMASTLPTPELQKIALKGYSDEEFISAVKEILCVWLHMEAMDQGGEGMPGWLLSFFHLSLGAADYMIAKPRAQDVMRSYEQCGDAPSLCHECSTRASRLLGFGEAATAMAPAVYPVLLYTAAARQQILAKSLTIATEELRLQAA